MDYSGGITTMPLLGIYKYQDVQEINPGMFTWNPNDRYAGAAELERKISTLENNNE